MEKETEKEIVEDITAEVLADKSLVSADAVLKSTSKELKNDAKDAGKKALYQNAQRQKERNARVEVAVGEIQSKLIGVNRITKVVKGGRTLRFNAVVIVGDKAGRVAVGNGKAREVTEAIKKAEQDGKKQFITVPIVKATLPHEITGAFGTSQVKMMPAAAGHGIIAGGPVKAVLELAGYHDVTAKCYGSTNSTNVVKAVINGLSQLRTREQVMQLRGTQQVVDKRKAKN
jgi:small subunit ribosomal protein S5